MDAAPHTGDRVLAALREGAITPRTILHVTVLIDHDVVDGVPAARFVADAVRRLEGAVGT